jgi:tetratricopeptide (TPR) repeat protein
MLEKAIAVQPATANDYNDLAWLLARKPDSTLRNQGRAVELAREAVRRAPNASHFRKTLGVARYRAGDLKGAIEALAKSEELAPGKVLGFNAFFLAMAHWHLGHKHESRQWYDRAVQWMKKNRPKDHELRRFRAEAAGLLGLEAQTEREGQTAPADAAMPDGPGAFARP